MLMPMVGRTEGIGLSFLPFLDLFAFLHLFEDVSVLGGGEGNGASWVWSFLFFQ